MLKPLFGSENCEKALVFLVAREEGYPRQIAKFFDADFRGIYNQLDKLEAGGVLRSRTVGRTRLYSFNPRYPVLEELKNLLEKVLSLYPEDKRQALLMNRRRPRRRGKPL
ncbi:MAG: winged helix-turn-helix domain-containing protein [bacterium]